MRQNYPTWKFRVPNRCGDLLVVDEKPHPVFLCHSVDFLHRTVRYFLRDCYHDQLKAHLKSGFNPLLSLAKISLSLLKALPVYNFRDRNSLHQVIGLTDELLYYAYETERNSTPEVDRELEAILDDLDVVNTQHSRKLGARSQKVRNHWTHACDSPVSRDHDVYREGGNCTFIALAVQARLVRYVTSKLIANPNLLHAKQGRPLLDYALRPRRATPISLDYHSARDDPNIDINMVQLLLDHGADPNKAVHLNDGESVWGLFLLSIHETNKADGATAVVSENMKRAWYRACEALIKAGARNTPFVNDRGGWGPASILEVIFRGTEAAKLEEQMKEVERTKESSGSSCLVM